MTQARDVLVVEVAEGTDELVARLTELGLAVTPRRPGAAGAAGTPDDTYDVIMRRGRPSSTCRCTRSTSAATASPSSSPTAPCQAPRRPLMSEPPPVSSTTSATSATTGPGSAAATRSGRSTSTACATAFGLGRSAKREDLPVVVVGIVMLRRRRSLTAIAGAVGGEVPADVLAVPGHIGGPGRSCSAPWSAPELVSPGPARRGAAAVLLPAADAAATTRWRSSPRWSSRCSCCWPRRCC